MSSPSKVLFIPVDNGDALSDAAKRFETLLHAFSLDGFITDGTEVQVKLHFGEKGNRGYVRPELIRVLSDAVRDRGGSTVVSDSNTLYRGHRLKSADHLALAHEHGFTDSVVGGRVAIADEKIEGATVTLPVNGRFVKEAKLLRFYTEAEALISVAHFKGHLVTGFGGALKNVGMGCASREGKLAQHAAVAPFVIAKKCIGCKACFEVCPAGAITVSGGKAFLDAKKCIGCASCIAACRSGAIELDWGGGAGAMTEKMVEYAAAAFGTPGKKICVNFVTRVTAECDCLAKDDPRIVPDIGILMGTDPVAVDQACYDLVCSKAGGFDPFRKAHPNRDCVRQLDYAESMGVGVRSYNLVEVTPE